MTKTLLATLVLGTAVAFAGPACADKFKVTLDSKSEVPANTSAGTGTADVDYDAATKKLTWKLTYSGLTGPRPPRTSMAPPKPARTPASRFRSRTPPRARPKAARR